VGARDDAVAAGHAEQAGGAALLGVGLAAVVAGAIALVLPERAAARASAWLVPARGGLAVGGAF
jgi:hypothetical protein